MKYILILTLILTGCGGSPFVTLGAGYRTDISDKILIENSDCRDIGFIEAGYEYDQCPLGADSCEIGYFHTSGITCGWPFGKGRPETQTDDIGFKLKWGGK